MGYYPIFVELNGKRCLVVGGGNVGLQKVGGLLAAGAALTLVSPDLHPELQKLHDDGRFRWLARDYASGDVDGYDLVMVATDDGAINATVAAEARARKIWVNSADDVPNCDFILPSVVRKGQIVVCASTGGASPALARRLREELDAYLDDDFPALANLLAEVRRELRARGLVPDAEIWQQAITGQVRVLVAQRRVGQAKALLLKGLGVGIDPAPLDAELAGVPLPALSALGRSA